jgi:DNA-binding NarL/FixJ family response regulator
MEVAFGAGNGMEVIELLKTHTVDVLLLDLNMPIMDGRQTLNYLRDNYPGIRILILSLNYSDQLVRKYMQLGVRGYLCKDFEYETVLESIRSVHHQGFFFHDKVSRELLAQLIANKTVNPIVANDPLSSRELEIIILVCQEKTNLEIGEALSISHRTVQNHRLRITKKTGARNAVGVLAYALRHGLFKL